MASNIVRPDSQGRVSLARFGVQPNQAFWAEEDEEGRIRLTPVPKDWDNGAHDAYLEED